MSALVTEAHRAITESVCELLDLEEMVGPSPAERAAQLIADSEARACAELRALVGTIRSQLNLIPRNVGDITPEGHSHETGAAIDQLRAVFPKILEALGNGACCTPDVSVEFIKAIPNEVAEVVAQLRAEVRAILKIVNEQTARAESAEREVERLKGSCEFADFQRQQARAERAEAEVKKLTGFYNEIVVECGHDRIVREYRQRGELLRDEANRRKEAEADLATAKAIIASIEEDGTEEHNAAVRLRRELATERARLNWLMAGGVCMVQHAGGFHVSRLHAPVSRAHIDAAMKEETK